MSDGYGDDMFSDDEDVPRRPGGRGGAIVVGLITVIAVAVLVWWWFLGGSPEPEESTSATPVATVTETVTATPSPSTTPSATASGAASASASAATCKPFGTDQSTESFADWPAELAGESLWGVDMRVGTHDCYDRWVVEFDGDGAMPGWSVTVHDSSTFMADPSGEDIDPLAGSSSLEVLVAAWFDGTPIGQDAYAGETDIVTDGYPAIQEARIISGFEGITQVGIGLDEARPYRVAWLTDPGRLVIDVYNG